MEEFYDLRVLKRVVHPIDRLVQYQIREHARSLNSYKVPSTALKDFHDVTPRLVADFRRQAYAFVRHVRDNPEEYGMFYILAKDKCQWTNVVFFDYENVSLLRDKTRILSQVRMIASQLAKPDTNEFDATCLYLLYFYILLVNPHCNWVTVDYLMHGNRYHQYLTMDAGTEKTNVKK